MRNGDLVAFKNDNTKPIYVITDLKYGKCRLKILGWGQRNQYAAGTYTEDNIKSFGVIIPSIIKKWEGLI